MGHYFTNDDNLELNIQKVPVEINKIRYYFYTDNGVFSKGELDYGTELLLKTLDIKDVSTKTFLDIGCGCGPIGIYLSKLNALKVDMTDVNLKSILLSKKASLEQNLKTNVFESFSYEKIIDKYDYIISNPPIRVGKKVLYDIIMNAKLHLNAGGEMWIVVRKKQGADSLVRDMKKTYNVTIVDKKKGFLIIKAQ
ncbi:MAG: methyltransferase [Bacilli bacterium]